MAGVLLSFEVEAETASEIDRLTAGRAIGRRTRAAFAREAIREKLAREGGNASGDGTSVPRSLGPSVPASKSKRRRAGCVRTALGGRVDVTA